MDTELIQNYWQKFLSTLPANSPYRSKAFISEGWGDGPEMADELGTLIAAGTKTATCSALWEWEAEGEPIPKTGTVTGLLAGGSSNLLLALATQDWQGIQRRDAAGV
jgi:uncharacterized protein YhfF